jgi:hypothetical protein
LTNLRVTWQSRKQRVRAYGPAQSDVWVGWRALSEEFLKLLHVEARIARDAAHRKSIYRIVARNRHNSNAIRHHDVLALADDAKAGLLQSPDGIEVIDAGNLRHR